MNRGDSESVSNSRVHLRLVSIEEESKSVEILLEIPSDADVLRALFAEAQEIEAWYGANFYSSFIKKHGRRPSREQAATIGRLLGGHVEADDGSMQPPLTKGDRGALRRIKARRKVASATGHI